MIEVKNLTKLYGKFKAVDDVSLCAADGEVTILLGPNGAGKSTTIKSITNLLQYKGDIKINGVANSSLDAKKGFGYIPEAPVLYDLLTIDEHVEFIAVRITVRLQMNISPCSSWRTNAKKRFVSCPKG